MKMTQRTKSLKTWNTILIILISALWLATLGFMIVYGFVLNSKPSEGDGVGKQIVEVLYPSCVAYIVAIALYIFVTKKIKTMGWMAAVILASYFIGNTAMYIVFGLWILDEYILTPIQKRVREKYIINKEIDLRE